MSNNGIVRGENYVIANFTGDEITSEEIDEYEADQKWFNRMSELGVCETNIVVNGQHATVIACCVSSASFVGVGDNWYDSTIAARKLAAKSLIPWAAELFGSLVFDENGIN